MAKFRIEFTYRERKAGEAVRTGWGTEEGLNAVQARRNFERYNDHLTVQKVTRMDEKATA